MLKHPLKGRIKYLKFRLVWLKNAHYSWKCVIEIPAELIIMDPALKSADKWKYHTFILFLEALESGDISKHISGNTFIYINGPVSRIRCCSATTCAPYWTYLIVTRKWIVSGLTSCCLCDFRAGSFKKLVCRKIQTQSYWLIHNLTRGINFQHHTWLS